MPTPPTIPRAVLILLPTLVVLPLVGRFGGVEYDVIADNTSNVLRGIVPAVALSLVWGIVMAWRAGWLKPIFATQPASSMPRVLWMIPFCWFCLCLFRLVSTPWHAFELTYLGVLAIAMIMVGFNEEILFRGILAYGARGPGPWSEARTMLVSALGFGLFHLPNLLVGQALWPTLIQVGYAFLMGLALSVSMRLSGSILLPIAMHALWDFAIFTSKGQTMSTSLSLLSFAMLLIVVLLLIVAVAWCLGKKARPVQH